MAPSRGESLVSLRVERGNLQDVPAIVALENSLNPSSPWSEKTFQKILKDKNWLILVAKLDEKVIGYLVAQIVGDEGELHDIAVLPEHRRKGVGRFLMEKLLAQGVQKATLLVRTSNFTAQKFYQQFGFRQMGVRKNYYDSPSEDAVVYGKIHQANGL